MEISSFLKCKPKLFNKYTDNLIDATSTFQTPNEVNTLISKILYIALCDCIDSYVNVHVLNKLNDSNFIPIQVRLADSLIMQEYDIKETPTILFFDDTDNIVARWERIPKTLKIIESSGDQINIIKEKRAYRNGKYLKHTFQELIEILNKHS